MRKTQEPKPMPRRRELLENPVMLCNQISRLARARVRRDGEMEGVLSQPGARLILSHLSVQDGQSQHDLVRATHLRPPSVSVIVRKMEEEGMVRRECDSHDMRIFRVYLTDFGREADRRAIERIQKTDAIAMEGLTAQECETLMTLLGRMRDRLVAEAQQNETNTEDLT